MWVVFMMLSQRKRIMLLRKNYALDTNLFCRKAMVPSEFDGDAAAIEAQRRGVTGLTASSEPDPFFLVTHVLARFVLRPR
jgi:hypothetical protein